MKSRTLADEGKIGAGETARQKVELAGLSMKGSDVAVDRDVRPVFAQNFPAERIDLAKEFGLESPGSLKPETESANAGEEVENRKRSRGRRHQSWVRDSAPECNQCVCAVSFIHWNDPPTRLESGIENFLDSGQIALVGIDVNLSVERCGWPEPAEADLEVTLGIQYLRAPED